MFFFWNDKNQPLTCLLVIIDYVQGTVSIITSDPQYKDVRFPIMVILKALSDR